MFISFFPRPLWFLISAIIWCVAGALLWYGPAHLIFSHMMAFSTVAAHGVPDNALRFITPEALGYYSYFWLAALLFTLFWALVSPHPWQRWSVLGSALIFFVSWFYVQIGLAINSWYEPFYDLIQRCISHPNSVPVGQLYHQMLGFLSIALIAVVVDVLNQFFVSHYIFRWRTAMNHYYMAHWPQLRHVEGAAQRVQEDTMRFSSTLEDVGSSLINAVMTLMAFMPVLIALSAHVKSVPLLGSIPYALVIAAVVWSLFGTGLLALVGIKLPGLSFRNQQVEAALRKELVYGEDDASRAAPPTVSDLFSRVRKNYFRFYFHYCYFNLARACYLQIDAVFSLFILSPALVTGAISLGLLTQITNVFDQVRSAFQYLINAWSTLVELMSIYKRLRGFEQTLAAVPAQQQNLPA